MLDKFFKVVARYLEIYVDCFADRPLAISILLFVSGFACGTWAVYSAM